VCYITTYNILLSLISSLYNTLSIDTIMIYHQGAGRAGAGGRSGFWQKGKEKGIETYVWYGYGM